MDTLLQLLDLTVRSAVPLLLACLAGLYSERSGIVDIGLEGKMLIGAFAGGAAAAMTGSAWAGLLAAVLAAVFLSLVHGFASITHRGNQIVSGVAINFIAAGMAALIGNAWFCMGGRTPQLDADGRFSPIDLPFAEALSGIPIVGPVYAELISGHNLIAYAAFALVPITWWVLFRTRFGLRLRAVGENPAAVDTAGISVSWARYRAVMICGALLRYGRRLSGDRRVGWLREGHDRRSRLHSAGSAHLCQMAAGRGHVGLPAIRLPRCIGNPLSRCRPATGRAWCRCS